MQSRAEAAKTLQKVIQQGRSLNQAMQPHQDAFYKALCFGTLRWYHQLTAIANQLLTKPLHPKDTDIFALLLIGLYQLREMHIPPYAAINETVKTCKTLKKTWATGLINAVLRQYQRTQTFELNDFELNDIEAKYAHPKWLIKLLQTSWPNDWENIIKHNNQHPPLSLRVNQQKSSRDDYLQKLKVVNIHAIPAPHLQRAIIVAPTDVSNLPGFNDGLISVQDCAAQLSAEFLQLHPSLRVLDACAAPGGKTMHILEQEPTCDVIAIDSDCERLQKIAENLSRISTTANLICNDAANTDDWWDGNQFDRLLIDAPCSATGIIRRHPDIKLLRRKEDITQFASQQKRLLNALWPLLKPNGVLLYVTCSILPAENEEQLSHFCAQHSDARPIPIKKDFGKPLKYGWQLLPSDTMDGFYYCCLTKKD